ncbi:MAG: hypothetical protein IPF92_12200 [Myxococcales bacterium]|nr:hypothetical protein [Myxococcales bacterium]HQY60841.1 hypothetical protein [Polyangiaceae bacterium]
MTMGACMKKWSGLVFRGVAALSLASGVGVVACSSDAPPAAEVDAGAPEASVSAEAAAPPPLGGDLGFTPSNLSLAGLDLANVGDIVIDKTGCTWSTASLDASCGDAKKMVFKQIDQPGAGKIGMYVVRSLRVEPNGALSLRGTYAGAIVALDKLDILGTVSVGVGSNSASAGGFVGTGNNGKGGGPGGGAAGSPSNAPGGGGYCGKGGNGGASSSGAPGAGGAPWGTAENVPLVGGASGGGGAVDKGGSGGGALQLVAKNFITIGTTGVVTAGGGRGGFGGVSSQPPGAGGSGGALLLESPVITVQGVVAANGGGGGSKSDDNQNGQGSGTPAKGATGPSTGGNGSAGDTAVGGDGTYVAGPGGGGGGGAGRVRFNTRGAGPSLTGTVSPSVASACATSGQLK